MTQRKFPAHPVLMIDDEAAVLKAYNLTLRSAGINNTRLVQDAAIVMDLLAQKEIEVILLDLTMPQISGNELLQKITSEFPAIPVIIVTGNNEVQNAVNCMKHNAFDYMVKPVEASRLISGVKRAIEIRQLSHENQKLKERLISDHLKHPEAFSSMVTNNKIMTALFKYTESVAASPHPILISGETGTGKELMAKAIHRLSKEKGPFISINVAGVDDNAFTDTLFGHAKGAFTGADTPRTGLVEKAAGGTLFLDEIGDLKAESQIKLLRLLQEHEYYPLGSDTAKIMETRIIAATNQDLISLQQSGRFRKDLYYRLSTHSIDIPPLRERLDDLTLLLDFFLEEASLLYKKNKPSFPSELMVLLRNYDFPGNIRELKGIVYDALSVHPSGKLSMELFKKHIKHGQSGCESSVGSPDLIDGFEFSSFKSLPTIAEAQLLLMQEALKRTENNKSMAAQMLGISRQRLIRHLKSAGH